MKVALCFWGLCRSTHQTISSIEEMIFQSLKEAGIQYDTFVHTYRFFRPYNNIRAEEYSIQLKNTTYKLLQPTYELVEYQDTVDIQLGLEKYRTKGNPWENDDEGTFQTLDNHIRSLWSLAQVTRLWKESGQVYDAIVYLRPDVRYLVPLHAGLLTGLSHNTIRVPDFHLIQGCNDRFAIGKPSVMEVYGNRYFQALEYSKKAPLHSETYLAKVLQTAGIKIQHIPFRFQRVRANGRTCKADLELTRGHT